MYSVNLERTIRTGSAPRLNETCKDVLCWTVKGVLDEMLGMPSNRSVLNICTSQSPPPCECEFHILVPSMDMNSVCMYKLKRSATQENKLRDVKQSMYVIPTSWVCQGVVNGRPSELMHAMQQNSECTTTPMDLPLAINLLVQACCTSCYGVTCCPSFTLKNRQLFVRAHWVIIKLWKEAHSACHVTLRLT